MPAAPAPRVRRPPPPLRQVEVVRVERRRPRLVRVTLGGPELHGFVAPAPAGSIRVQLPDEPGGPLIMPTWNGNAFFHTDGRRPLIRTLTPLRHDPEANELDIDVVLHGPGPLATWAAEAHPGDPAAVSGPGRGYTFDPEAARFVFAGDESAMPAIGQLLDALPPAADAMAVVELAAPDGRIDLTQRSGVDVRWLDRPAGAAPGEALVPAVLDLELTPTTRLWVAGEAAAVQRIRRHLFGTLDTPRGRAMVRGYWKHGRAGDDDEAASE